MSATFKPSPIFEWNWTCKADVIVNQGGTSSGKTYSLLQLLILKGMQEPNLVITIVGQDMPNLKVGAIRDINTIFRHAFFKQFLLGVNKTDKVYTLRNGSILEFKSYGDAQDAKNGKRDYSFFNEANGVPYAIYEEVAVRTRRQVFLDYNPTAPFWVHDKLIGTKDTQLFISNFKHNPFLDAKTIKKIRRYKTTDPERWRVYGLGLTGALDGVIFDRVTWVSEFPEEAKKQCLGLDFGFVNDPTALVRLGLLGGELYLQKICYDTGMLNGDIARVITDAGFKNLPIVADSAEAKSIRYLSDKGLRIKPSAKGRGSIVGGINAVKEYKLNIVADKDFKHEQQNYIWQKDRRTGKTTNKPIDNHNHIWDAVRYGFQNINKARGILATT